MSSDNLFRRFWRHLRFDIPRVAAHATSRRRVGIVFLTVLFLILAFSVIYGPIALFEYKFGGGAIGLAIVVIMYVLAFGLRKGLRRCVDDA
jgi:hypothetical protein